MGKTAFDAKRQSVFLLDPDEVVILQGDDEPNPLQRTRAELPVDEGLVDNMMLLGFLSTISVRKDGSSAVVVSGRQRVKAAREANKRLRAAGKEPIMVRAVVESGDDAGLTAIGIALNHGAQSDGPVAEALELAYFLKLGRTEQQAATAFLKPLSWVKQTLALLDTHQSVQNAVTRGQLSVSAAAKLSKLKKEEQAAELKTLLADVKEGKKATVASVTKAVVKKGASKESLAPSKKQIREAMEKAEKNGYRTVRAVLEWVLTGKKSADFKPE